MAGTFAGRVQIPAFFEAIRDLRTELEPLAYQEALGFEEYNTALEEQRLLLDDLKNVLFMHGIYLPVPQGFDNGQLYQVNGVPRALVEDPNGAVPLRVNNARVRLNRQIARFNLIGTLAQPLHDRVVDLEEKILRGVHWLADAHVGSTCKSCNNVFEHPPIIIREGEEHVGCPACGQLLDPGISTTLSII